MPSAVEQNPTEAAPAETKDSAADPYRLSDAADKRQGRNFVMIALFQIIMRTGWIFKTESIIMPAVLDTITGGGPWGGMLRGCLPVLNRLGHSIPPMLFSQRLKMLPQKRMAVLVCAFLMAVVFVGLSMMFAVTGGQPHWWMPLVFLLCYVMFFAATGINNLSLGTLQGKLVRATRRGRLLLTANFIGAITAIGAVLLLMPHWLHDDVQKFDRIFGFTALCFAISALTMLWVAEPSDDVREEVKSPRHLLGTAWKSFRTEQLNPDSTAAQIATSAASPSSRWPSARHWRCFLIIRLWVGATAWACRWTI